MVYEPISHNLHIKHTVVSLNLKGSLKTFPHETIAANEKSYVEDSRLQRGRHR